MPTKTGNSNVSLHQAHKNKKDEFYTSLGDIENELKHYKSFFKGKTVFCNCDDPYESNFFKYFAMHFNSLGLKKLITTCYDKSKVQGEQLNLFDVNDLNLDEDEQNKKKAYKVIITEVKDENGDGRVDLSDVEYLIKNKKNVLTLLEGNGDFRSKECIELLKEADIVVTNPPFSLIREYVNQLVEYGKSFLIISRYTAITAKDIFPLIKNNQMWLGHGFKGGVGFFRSFYEDVAHSSQHKEGLIRVSGVLWLTNLDYKEHHDFLPLYKRYTPEEYPKYENYDAIEVERTKLIPEDYDGVMGVPITFLEKFCPEQFEILGMCENEDLYGLKTRKYTTAECKQAYLDKFGKRGTYDLNASGVLRINGKLVKSFARILIRKKKD